MMPQHKGVPRALFLRAIGPASLVALMLVLAPDSLLGQHNTGLDVEKTCPVEPVQPGSDVTCTFTVTNNDTLHGVENLAITNTAPFPGGTPVPAQCLQAAVPVTVLGRGGSPTDTCGGSVTETVPPCGAVDIFFVDQVAANGTDCGLTCGVDDPPSDVFEGLPASGAASNAVIVLACTPTPTPTPTNTPTNTPVNTPTNTPTGVADTPTPTNTPPTEVPPVPTLSFPMLALLGLMLATAGLFLARRS